MKNYSLKLKIIFFLSLFAYMYFGEVSIINAQTDNQIRLMIVPEIFELQLEKGEVYYGKIKIHNRGEAAIPLEAIASNFDAEELTGTTILYDNFSIADNREDDVLSNPREWMKIENPNFILDPQETVSIKFSIAIPEKAENGGYYAIIFFEPKIYSSNNTEQGKNSISIVPKIGAPFLISVGKRKGSTNAGSLIISEFSIPEKFHLKKLENSIINFTGLFSTAYANTVKSFSLVETGQLQFNLKMKNNDAYHIKPYGKLAILSSSGKTIGETEIEKTTILPQKTREIPIDFNPGVPEIIKRLPVPFSDLIAKNLLFGKFRAILSLNSEGLSTTEEIEFWIFPWKIFLMIFLILAIFILSGKRIKIAVMVLIGKR